MFGVSLVLLVVQSKDMVEFKRVVRLLKYAWGIRREIKMFFFNPWMYPLIYVGVSQLV